MANTTLAPFGAQAQALNNITVDASISGSSQSNPVQGAAIYNALLGKSDILTIVEVDDTGSVTQALNPNKFYIFTGPLTSLTLTLTAVTGQNEIGIYAGQFTTDSTGCTLGLPATITVPESVPEIEGSKTYEFSILNNVIYCQEV